MSKETCITLKEPNTFKGWKRYSMKQYCKRTAVASLIANNIYFKAKFVIRFEESHFVITKWLVY
jgi:hypothetical protein